MNQKTINKKISIIGNALHSGKPVKMNLLPLAANSGIVFKRSDLKGNNIIIANYKNVSSTMLCTEISNTSGAKVATIEHLMAAFFFLGIDNVLVEINSSELPANDGSSYGYIVEILKVGIKELNAPKNILEILKPVDIVSEKWKLSIKPSDKFIVNCSIDFDGSKVIGKQSYIYKQDEYMYASDISKAKTFGFLKDMEYFHKNGIGLGSNTANTNVITENGLLNGCKLSYTDEFVKHKILDLCGDLYLSGYFIKGEITAYKPGHLANNSLLKAIFSNKENYNIKFTPKTMFLHYAERKDTGVINY